MFSFRLSELKYKFDTVGPSRSTRLELRLYFFSVLFIEQWTHRNLYDHLNVANRSMYV